MNVIMSIDSEKHEGLNEGSYIVDSDEFNEKKNTNKRQRALTQCLLDPDAENDTEDKEEQESPLRERFVDFMNKESVNDLGDQDVENIKEEGFYPLHLPKIINEKVDSQSDKEEQVQAVASLQKGANRFTSAKSIENLDRTLKVEKTHNIQI